MNLCEQCIKEGGGCCNNTESAIFVTLHDALRIKKATGLEFDEFLAFDKIPDAWFKELKKAQDAFLNMFVDNKILQLKLTDKGCPFLGPKGCLIFKHRPGLCRLFPFNYKIIKGKVVLSFEKLEDCTIVEKHADPERALKEMGENVEEFKKFCKRYDKELDMYLEYVPLISKGVPLERIIKKFKIKV